MMYRLGREQCRFVASVHLGRGMICRNKALSSSFWTTRSVPSSKYMHGDIHHRIVTSSEPRSSSMPPKAWRTRKSRHASTRPPRSCASGVSASSKNVSMGSTRLLGTGGRGAFPPNIIVGIKALACELPHELGIPLSRFSMSELKRAAIQRGIVASIGEATIWRWLSADALKPWNHRTWVFPRAPAFEVKAARILDLYEGLWEGEPLGENDWVLCAA